MCSERAGGSAAIHATIASNTSSSLDTWRSSRDSRSVVCSKPSPRNSSCPATSAKCDTACLRALWAREGQP